MTVLKGWLLVYLIGTTGVLLFYAAGLSGWFYDYPMPLFLGLFIVLATPLLLLLLKTTSAPGWNIAVLWLGALLISLRIVYAVLEMERSLQLNETLILTVIPLTGFIWAIIWTRYFLTSDRVAALFGREPLA